MSEVEHESTGWSGFSLYNALLQHEAAHAVLAHHLGLHVETVGVKEHPDGIRGYCTVSGGGLPWDYVGDAATQLAGRYADWRWLNGENRPLIPFEEFMANTCGYSAKDKGYVLETLEKAVEFNQDIGYPDEMLAELGGPDTLRDFYEAAAREARRAVEVHWPEICAVADALGDGVCDDEPLTGEDVKEIIEAVEAEQVA